jgi:hypothetical protein
MWSRVRSEAVRSVFPYARDNTLLLKKEVGTTRIQGIYTFPR